ncbi:MAG: hypothetical protein K5912_03145 [Alphaproteobacteria bacterium]|nr:hypothetical protein [Alphaproteobacteria bacterium]
MKVGIIGAGAWGTGLAFVVARGGSKVVLWSFDGGYKDFDGARLPEQVTVTKDMSELADCDVWLAVTPAAFFRETMIRAGQNHKKQPIIICTKGAEPKSGKFMTEVLHEAIPGAKNIGILAGPQFASEVARGVPTGTTLAGNKKIRDNGRIIFKNLHLSLSHDVIGAEICSIGKNAVSLISGYVKIRGEGENQSALVMTAAWGEVVNLGLKLGAKLPTFLDFCGLGDLLLTATSQTSRNFSAGVSLAQGKKPVGTVEGISALNGLVKKAQKADIKVPLLKKMHNRFSKNK